MHSNQTSLIEECFDAIGQFISILDGHGLIIKVNHATLQLTGLTQEQATQIPLWELPWFALTRQNRRILKQAFIQAAQGSPIHQEIKLRRDRQGSHVFDFSVKPIQSPTGAPVLFIAEGRDVTAYRNTSEALYQSQARFQTIFEQAGMGIVIGRPNARILDANPAFQALVGYPLTELRRLDELDLTHPLDKKANRKLFNELVAGKRDHFSFEKRYLTKDGLTVWTHTSTSFMHSQDGESKYVISMVENITAHKQIEAELDELQQRLMRGRELERLKVAQDLHDGPLQEIIGISYQVQELENSLLPASSSEQLQAIRSNITTLAGSIRAICGELRPPTLAPFGLEKTILSHAEGFRKTHPQLILTHKLDHDGLLLPEHDRLVLFRIYQESLNNIVRHAQAKNIRIRFRLGPSKAVLEIQDDGVGFEMPNHLVKLVRQGHLGLVGAMERAREVDGDLEVNTAPGHGTLIRVTVPLKEDHPTIPVIESSQR